MSRTPRLRLIVLAPLLVALVGCGGAEDADTTAGSDSSVAEGKASGDKGAGKKGAGKKGAGKKGAGKKGSGKKGGTQPTESPASESQPSESQPSESQSPESGPDAQSYIDALVRSMSATEGAIMEPEQAQCFAAQVVDQLDATRVQAAGAPAQAARGAEVLDFRSLKLSRAEGEALHGSLTGCGYDMRTSLLTDLSTGEQLDPEVMQCSQQAVSDDQLRNFVVTMMVEGGEAAQRANPDLLQGLFACAFGGATQSP